MLDESHVQENNWNLTTFKLNWKIENFSLALKKILVSEEFTVGDRNNFTKWIMNLVVDGVEGENGFISFGLERSRDQGPDIVLLNWEVTLKVGAQSYEPVENRHSFEVNSSKEINLQPVTEVMKHLHPFKADVIVVECFLLVRDEEESTNQSVPPVPGLKYLSEDLHRLKTENINTLADVTIKVGDREIKAHKAILCRNKVFDEYIEKAQENIIELPNLDYEDVDKFITFLYSGNIDEIIANPSISMMKCAAHFNNEILKSYYIPEELNLFTLIDAQTHQFRWTVKGIPTELVPFKLSPLIRSDSMCTRWRLILSVQPKTSSDDDDCISLYAMITNGHPSYFCLEFGVANQARKLVHTKKIIRVDGCYDNLGFRNFIKISDLNASIYVDEKLKIVFRVRTSNGMDESMIGCRNLSFVSSTVNSYEQLSLDLLNLLKTGKFCDIIIKFNNKLHSAHRCVLAPRSTEFSRIINRMPPKNDPVTLENIEDDTLEPILEYLYGGILKNYDQEKFEKIFDSALALGIQSLINECQRVLNAARHNV